MRFALVEEGDGVFALVDLTRWYIGDGAQEVAHGSLSIRAEQYPAVAVSALS